MSTGSLPSPDRMTLYDGKVHVWQLPATARGDRGVVARTLAQYLDVGAGELRFDVDSRGKPILAPRHGSRLRFSVARGGDVTVLAVSMAAEIGVDVEPLRREPGQWALVREALTDREREDLPVGEEERAFEFLRAWVRKEALLKAAGVGLAVEPRLVELKGCEIVSLPTGTSIRWEIRAANTLTGLDTATPVTFTTPSTMPPVDVAARLATAVRTARQRRIGSPRRAMATASESSTPTTTRA